MSNVPDPSSAMTMTWLTVHEETASAHMQHAAAAKVRKLFGMNKT